MSLRDELSDLIGAEVQAHQITLNGKTKPLHFRQITDAEGRTIFRVVESESDADRGNRIMRSLVLASSCDASGERNATVEEVEGLGSATLQALFAAAAATNNIPLTQSTESASDEGASPKV
ncbi:MULTISPECIES: hypothetical protein [Hydrocarboniphaga]|uniref:Uncharacterized protein n=1 Tax=Hydrocarboniphaga effusa AP103 TaxID=1172194 RepID=I8T8V3_9GAMM|nr:MULTISPECIES: hypothetical protein [Hydrocarboniphaga]EIT70006.1 hypothetical protein WQQ_01430 [Hydrocarboniphaga effusa AP103]EIT70193.1 hypothetical protein WQQ_03300 [Hydrocarboniphaga effusa AP103]MDZ4077177.1 hypothetical protein [Hydrocarboniphaga sp.]